ncbi:MAG: S49 family peptidase [Gammaproteobacteria bacterium]|nr:S49 family peptidase [Gammaproteobacteria bacterium]
MPNWSDLVKEIGQLGSPYDILRRKYIKDLSDYTKRNVICYYSGFLQKPELGASNAVNDSDKNGFMTTINGLDASLGLDLILHTPGGDTAATESIVDYLWQIFSGDVRCFVPQMAMSAGTMIACSSKEIWMGKQSSLGPVDPQFNGIPAHGVLEEFKRAHDEIISDPRTIPLWQPIIAKYSPAFLGECEKAVKWSNELVTDWLSRNMLAGKENSQDIISEIIKELGDHSVSYAHNRHLSFNKCRDIGLEVRELESDQELQDKVLSVHHIYYHTLSSSPAFKILENQNGMAFIQSAQQIMVPPQQVNQGGDLAMKLLPNQIPVAGEEKSA